MTDNRRAVYLIERASDARPFCGCGRTTSAVAHSDGIWLECASLSDAREGRIARSWRALSAGPTPASSSSIRRPSRPESSRPQPRAGSDVTNPQRSTWTVGTRGRAVGVHLDGVGASGRQDAAAEVDARAVETELPAIWPQQVQRRPSTQAAVASRRRPARPSRRTCSGAIRRSGRSSRSRCRRGGSPRSSPPARRSTGSRVHVPVAVSSA